MRIKIPEVPKFKSMSKEKYKTHNWKFLRRFFHANYFVCERCNTYIKRPIPYCADGNEIIFGTDLSCDEGVIKDILE